MDQEFEVVVIGGGPAGYVAAIRAAQLGLKTACVEWQSWHDPQGQVRLGGTCLNVGCIPSKALLKSSELYYAACHAFPMHGITVEGVKIDVPTMMRRKDNIIAQLTQGLRGLFRKNKVTLLPGRGRLTGREDEKWCLEITDRAGQRTAVAATHVIIATGSRPRALPGIEIDNRLICDNEGALAFEAVPPRLGVIGAGVIGLELGSVWQRLGSQVTILEALPEFLTAADEAVRKEAWKVFTQKQGLDIRLGAQISKVSPTGTAVSIEYEHNGEPATLEVDKLIVAVGRVPNTAGLGGEEIGLPLDERGAIVVDEHCHTPLDNLWAVGDVVRGPMLAHKGMEEGVMVAERIAGQAGRVDYEIIPWVIYTDPEIAWVGQTEAQLKKAGIDYRVGQVPFLANGRALGQGDTTGFVKLLSCAKTDRLLGAHIVGANASELIGEAVVAMAFGASSEDLARVSHAHPTLSEVMHEAALAVDQRALHF